MFEFAAGQVQQEERERRIAEGLRRRELLAATQSAEGQPTKPWPVATAPRRAQTPARAHAER